MRVAILTNIFEKYSQYREVEEDLEEFGKNIKSALISLGHEALIFNVNDEDFYEKLKRAKFDLVFNVAERIRGSSLLEPHAAAMLEVLNIPFTGSSSLTLATCIYKARVKEILKYHGLPTPNFQIFYSAKEELNPALQFPLIIKPEHMDNSIGIKDNSVLINKRGLWKKIKYINEELGQPALVEEFIQGREFSVGIIGNGQPKVLPPCEIKFNSRLKDIQKIASYQAKWLSENENYHESIYTCGSKLAAETVRRIKEVALKVYRIFDLRDYATIDLRVDKNRIPFILEVNPNPGLSNGNAILPIIFEEIDSSYNDLINTIVNYARQRYNI